VGGVAAAAAGKGRFEQLSWAAVFGGRVRVVAVGRRCEVGVVFLPAAGESDVEVVRPPVFRSVRPPVFRSISLESLPSSERAGVSS
jgi:hypothetical protein